MPDSLSKDGHFMVNRENFFNFQYCNPNFDISLDIESKYNNKH